MEALVRRILVQYGFSDAVLLGHGKGYRNHSYPARLTDGSVVNVMLYKRESGMRERIIRANTVANFKYAHSLPARHTHDERIVQLLSARGETYAALYDYLPGETIPWEAYTQKHIKALGKCLSDLHAVLRECDIATLPTVEDEYRVIVNRMRQYFAQTGVRSALRQKLQLSIAQDIFTKFDYLLSVCEELADRQTLHMDFVRSNILFTETAAGPEISGILDFEKTALGSPLFDIARTLAFLLVDCKYKPPDKIRKYFLFSGYQKRGTANFRNPAVNLPDGHSNLLEELVQLFLVYDFYKFLKHNPYESLNHNEHFVRTRDILLARALIRPIASR